MYTITEQIWYNGYVGYTEIVAMMAQGFTDILNLDLPYMEHARIAELGITVHDHLLKDMGEMTVDQACRGVSIVRECVEAGGTIYVHCNAGISRSPTIVGLYLLVYGGSALMAARELIDYHLVSDETIRAVKDRLAHG